MSAVIRFLLFLLWAGAVPVLSGLLPCSVLPADKRSFHLVAVTGYLTTFAVFEVLGLPVLFLTEMGNFRLLLILYVCASVMLIAAGVVVCHRSGGVCKTNLHRLIDTKRGKNVSGKPFHAQPEAVVFWCIFLCLLAFELYMSYTRASFDGDDAYYVAQSLQTWQTGTMYHYIPYTGVTTTLDGRHAMAMIPMWISAVASLCGTHPTIVTHSMLPVVLIPLADLCFYTAARALLYDKVGSKRSRRMLPAFMVILAVMQIFGNISIYTPETFLLMRTWQGKTVFVNIVIPVCFSALLLLAHNMDQPKGRRYVYLLAALMNCAAGFCTSLAPFFTAFLFLVGGLYLSIGYRKKQIFAGCLICCIPNLIYGLILLRVMLPTLLA